jgi:2-oxoglutarate ferredoxin oxidoreductase subunit gamma
MDNSVVIAGFGGQGVILAGKILAQAGMNHGLEVTWLPSYGPEMRGGTANCTVVLSNDPIGSPIVDCPTGLIALNLPSLDKFEPTVTANGVIIMNSSLIQRRTKRRDVRCFSPALNDLAEKAGSEKATNMIALGAYIKVTGIIPLSTVQTAMAQMLKKEGKDKSIPLNRKALQEGYNALHE